MSACDICIILHSGLGRYLSGKLGVGPSIVNVLIPVSSTSYRDLVGQIKSLPIHFWVIEVLLLRVPGREYSAVSTSLALRTF